MQNEKMTGYFIQMHENDYILHSSEPLEHCNGPSPASFVGYRHLQTRLWISNGLDNGITTFVMSTI